MLLLCGVWGAIPTGTEAGVAGLLLIPLIPLFARLPGFWTEFGPVPLIPIDCCAGIGVFGCNEAVAIDPGADWSMSILSNGFIGSKTCKNTINSN